MNLTFLVVPCTCWHNEVQRWSVSCLVSFSSVFPQLRQCVKIVASGCEKTQYHSSRNLLLHRKACNLTQVITDGTLHFLALTRHLSFHKMFVHVESLNSGIDYRHGMYWPGSEENSFVIFIHNIPASELGIVETLIHVSAISMFPFTVFGDAS